MPDTSKYKSVGINIDSYNKLKKLSEDKRRSIGQQTALIIDKAFDSEYGDKTKDLESVSKIQIGDNCLTDSGANIKILEINEMQRIPTQTYNFEVKNNDNYFADGVLVHNKKAPGEEESDKTGGLTGRGVEDVEILPEDPTI